MVLEVVEMAKLPNWSKNLDHLLVSQSVYHVR